MRWPGGACRPCQTLLAAQMAGSASLASLLERDARVEGYQARAALGLPLFGAARQQKKG